jgi:pimeloyl-ACP methyl ester carboxylesterase
MHFARLASVAAIAALLVACRRSPGEPFPARPREAPAQIVTSGDVRLGVWTYGAGPATIVVVNGGPGASHECAARLASLASGTRRIALYDQRGVGESSAPGDDTAFALDDYARDLEAVRKGLGAEKIHVIGHSFGALVAMAYASAYPDRVLSLALVSPKAPDAATDAAGSARFEARVASLAQRGVLREAPAPDGDDCRAQSAAFVPALFADPGRSLPRDESVRTACSVRVMAATTARLEDYDVRPGLARITTPAIVLAGDADPFGDDAANAAVGALAATRASVVRLPRCGHFPWIECDAAFRPALEAFLAASGAR